MAQYSHAFKSETRSEAPKKGRVLDLVHLARQTLGDPGLEQEVLRIYADASRSYCGSIKAADSADALRINLHSLKGASAGVGANIVANAARAAEFELRETGDVCEETRGDIAITVEEVNAYIATLLKS